MYKFFFRVSLSPRIIFFVRNLRRVIAQKKNEEGVDGVVRLLRRSRGTVSLLAGVSERANSRVVDLRLSRCFY